MKFEQINENTIKVMIAKSDLEERGLTFFDLLGNQTQIESFFFNILDEVGMRKEFEDTQAVTFQVVPKKDGIDLYITKGIDNNWKKALTQDKNDAVDANTSIEQFIQFLEQERHSIKDNRSKTTTETAQSTKKRQTQKKLPDFQVFAFNTFTNYLSFAKRIKSEDVSENALFYYDNHYYWGQKTTTTEQLENIHYKAVEYGEPSYFSFYVIKEHGQAILLTDAIAQTHKNFK